MSHISRTGVFFLVFLLFSTLLLPGLAAGDELPGTKGWGVGDAYQKKINFNDMKHFKGIVVGKLEISPLPGMDPGLALLVRESDFDTITVHVGPLTFLEGLDVQEGERINLRGWWSEINGKMVIIASKIKQGDHFDFKLRLYADGTPLWTKDSKDAKGRNYRINIKGWEAGSEYNKAVKWPDELLHFKGTVVGVKEIIPLPDMSPGVALLVRESNYDTLTVHLGPKSFIGTLGIEEGDRVNLRGVWAKIGGEDVIIASKIKKGGFFEFKFRLYKDGTPLWTMDQDDLEDDNLGE